MEKIKVNSYSDHFNYVVHGGAAAAIFIGATAYTNSMVITGIATGISLTLQLTLHKYILRAFEKALPKKLKKSFSNTTPAHPHFFPDLPSTNATLDALNQYSDKFGLQEIPTLHLLHERKTYQPDNQDKKNKGLVKAIKKFLRTRVAKYANAAALSGQNNYVLITQNLVENLSQKELNGVVAHEAGHIAAKHTKKAKILSFLTSPASLMTFIVSLLVTFSSWKNFGLIVSGVFAGKIASGIFNKAMKLDEENKKDKIIAARFDKYATKTAIYGLAFIFAAPDLIIARLAHDVASQASLLTRKSLSRANEFQADRLAAEATETPMALSSALDKVKEFNLKLVEGVNERPEIKTQKSALKRMFERTMELYATHPRNERRVAQLEKIESRLNQKNFAHDGIKEPAL